MATSEDKASQEHIAEPAVSTTGSLQDEPALPQDADLFRALFLAHPDGVALVVEGRIALVNSRFAELSGYSAEEAIGMAPSDFVAAEVRERVDERIQAQTAGNERPPAEYSLIRKDGSTLAIDVHSRPLQYDGKPGLLTVMRDITEHKQAEEAQHASDARYRTLYELAGDAFLNVLPDGEIVDANIAAADLLGYTLEELKGLTGADDIVAPEVFQETEAAWREQLEERGQFLVDTLWVRKDGTRVPVAVSGKPLTVGGKEQLQLIGRDITERKQAEEALRALEEERYRRLLEVAPVGIVIVNDAGMIESINAQTESMFDYERKELIGKPVEMLMPERHRQIHPSHREAYMAAPHARQMGPGMDLYGVRKDGNMFPIDVSLNTMRTAAGVRVIAAVRDVTERVLAEKTLRDSEARFATAFHDSAVPVAIARMHDGKLIDVNDTLLTLIGLRRSEVIGHTAVELGVVMDPSVRAGAFAAVEQHNLIRDVPAQIQKKDGEMLEILMTSTQIEIDGESCRLTTFVDITERKRLEAELQAMRDDLESRVERQMDGDNRYKLTFREYNVLHLIADGKADKEIAVDLGISIYTVHRHVSHILAKMDSPSRTEAGTRALREGLLD